MKYSKIIVFLFVFQMLFSNTLFSQQIKGIIDAKQVINNAITAMGGKKYLQSIKSLYMDFVDTEDTQYHLIIKQMLPFKLSTQTVDNGKTTDQELFDGNNFYVISNGKKIKSKDYPASVKNLTKSIFLELDYLDTTLWKLQLTDEEEVNGEACYKIKATSNNGTRIILYYSNTTFYLLRVDNISNTEKGKNTIDHTTWFSDYQKFGKLSHYTLMKIDYKDGGEPQTNKIVKLLINKKVTDDDFK